jgi:hypothetical protein
MWAGHGVLWSAGCGQDADWVGVFDSVKVKYTTKRMPGPVSQKLIL